ncbi:hypothetical protein TVAG_499530 [Trichomonas vaginalis G3]|uniref:Uncharacterized protein n=1 Tax=Trichomonas vaginalis (strain ATCC PRA-98 / G3) TaxID=412133 RepID=A2EIP0_TRIV3|nr:hypothetical protein TVAGG3_0960060 [Trichomonas vaginalis G3]EAY07467.1 hypothetical protein TVAG_499530 [Trichomonas vaginalis G3]KAI5487837.1 hypothetical protein TVAGG3_0960060 [Trichomonas vaginalis G3]|eukprot:XP_001319690.1 hypothetical protein [Trichomonas vaginalis G3]
MNKKVIEEMKINGTMNKLRALFLKEVCEEAIESKNKKLTNFKNTNTEEAYEIAADLVMQYLCSFALSMTYETIEVESNNTIHFDSRSNKIDELDFSGDEVAENAPIQALMHFIQNRKPIQPPKPKEKKKTKPESSKSQPKNNTKAKHAKVPQPKFLPKPPPLQNPVQTKKPSRFTDESTTEESINFSEQFPQNALRDPRPIPGNLKPGGPPPHMRKHTSYSEESSLDLSGY